MTKASEKNRIFDRCGRKKKKLHKEVGPVHPDKHKRAPVKEENTLPEQASDRTNPKRTRTILYVSQC